MKASDICFYMSHTKEENSSLQISEANNYIEGINFLKSEKILRLFNVSQSEYPV
jgi:hypothetical protein